MINMGNSLNELLISIGATLTAYVNDSNLVPQFSEYASNLVNDYRNLDHLLAGIGSPYIIGLISKPINHNFKITSPNKFLTYASLAVYWETKQAFERGNFQFDQFACDMAGLSIAYLIDKLFLEDKQIILYNN